MEHKKITRENLSYHLVEYMLRMVGKTMDIILNDDRWRFNTTMTSFQYSEFKIYAVKLMQKTLKINRTKAIDNFEWLYQRFGLRIKN